jgi:Holliday junction resolvase RusA-like endonuclease
MHIRLGGGRCKVGLREDGEYSVPWKNAMIKAIRAQVRELCVRWPDPVEVHAFFRFRCESAEYMDFEENPWPIGRQYGDEDKLRRNLLDALTQSALLADDSQVIGGVNFKRWTQDGEDPGVEIVVTPPRPLSVALAAERARLALPLGYEGWGLQDGS